MDENRNPNFQTEDTEIPGEGGFSPNASQAEPPQEQPEAPVPQEEAAQKKKSLSKKIKKEIREWVVALAIAVLAALLIRTFFFTLIRVDGNSMLDTLHDNERLFVTILDVKIGGVERGDVVICHYPGRYSDVKIGKLDLGFDTPTNFVKRVVGVPGDVLERKNNITYINGEAIDPLNFNCLPRRPDFEAYTLGEDEYFVVGDNRYNSHDSRDWQDSDPSGDVGPISLDMIVGKAQFVFWPFSAWRGIE